MKTLSCYAFPNADVMLYKYAEVIYLTLADIAHLGGVKLETLVNHLANRPPVYSATSLIIEINGIELASLEIAINYWLSINHSSIIARAWCRLLMTGKVMGILDSLQPVSTLEIADELPLTTSA